jgi:hypothetical protein
MQPIPYPVYYVLVVNDGEILAGHYWDDIDRAVLQLDGACRDHDYRIRSRGEHGGGRMHDISDAAGLGWNGGCGSGELFGRFYFRHYFLYAGYWEYQRSVRPSYAAEDNDGRGGMHH